MLAVALILLAVAILAYLVGRIWLIVNAFRTSVGWGLAVMFLAPIGSILFRMNYKDEARKPFYCGLVALILFGAFKTTMPDKVDAGSLSAYLSHGAKHQSSDAKDAGDEPKRPSNIPGMFAAQKKMELQIKLVALQRKSDELLDRKAALAKGDRAGAVQLAEEITKYNTELKAVTQEMKDRGLETAQR